LADSFVFPAGLSLATRQTVLQNPVGLNALSETIIGCGITVHRVYGPGLLESIYHGCLTIEMRKAGLLVETEQKVPVIYRGVTVGDGFKIDCIVENKIVVEVKLSRVWRPSTRRN
jgi:GxxExxY protein